MSSKRIKSPYVSRRGFVLGASATAASAGLAARSRVAFGQGKSPKQGGTIVYAMEAEPDILDPHACGGWHTSRLVLQMYDQLVEHDLTVSWQDGAPSKLVPSLATGWEISPDGTEYTFTLRKGVKFHDGTAFDAEAAKFNFDRIFDEDFEYFYPRAKAYRAADVYFLDRVEVLDQYRVKVILKEPFNSFLLRLANLGPGMVSMLSPTAVRKYGNEGMALNPVGTGPFKFVERVHGDRVVMERNPDYWGGNPKVGPFLDRIVVKPVSDAATRMAGLRSGEFDMIIVPLPDSRQQLEEAGFVWDQGTAHHNWYWAYNMTDPIFQDKRVRQALNYAVDRTALCRDVLNDTAFPMENGIVPPGMLSYDPSYKAYEYNPAKAKALLAEAGHADGFTTTFVTSTDGSGQLLPVPIAERVQADLRKVGVDMRIEASEWVSYFTKWISGGFKDVGAAQMSFGAPDPFWLEQTIGCTFHVGAVGGLNTGYYCNNEVDEVMKAARQAPPPAADDPYAPWGLSQEAADLWAKANRMATEDAPLMLVLSDKNPFVYAPKVKGKVQTALEWFTFRTIWIDEA
jgi:peptide/nickel transport system substrate-binding protein